MCPVAFGEVELNREPKRNKSYGKERRLKRKVREEREGRIEKYKKKDTSYRWEQKNNFWIKICATVSCY